MDWELRNSYLRGAAGTPGDVRHRWRAKEILPYGSWRFLHFGPDIGLSPGQTDRRLDL
jgi:hypothetical protein